MTRQVVSFFSSSRQCPVCGGNDVHRSRRKGLTERLLALGLMRPFRCRDCDTRHYAFQFRRRNEPIEQPNVRNVSPNKNSQMQFEFRK